MKQIFITGATSGIGLAAATELAAKGHKIFATARTIDKGNELLNQYKVRFPEGKGSIEIIQCDLSSFEEIVKACNILKAMCEYLDVIINDAGVWNFSYRESKNKIEETLHVNVLAPLLINHLLFDLLKKSSDAKTIFAASGLHQGEIDLKNLEFKNDFGGFRAYRQSKLAVILLCRLLSKKPEMLNIGVYCEHPGLVNTKLGRDANWFSNLFFKLMGSPPEKGAETIVFLAEEDKSKLISGEYYHNKRVEKITPQSYDMAVAQRLMDSLKPYLKNYLSTSSSFFD